MTATQMYEHMRKLMRVDKLDALHALQKTLYIAGTEMKSFYKGDQHLYVKVNNIPWTSIEIIAFLAKSKGLSITMRAFTVEEKVINDTVHLSYPYMQISKP